jgi:hypothetical protein
MRRPLFLIAGALVVISCDPVVTTTFRLTPSPAVREEVSDSGRAESDSLRPNAIAAVTRIALRFGLTTATPGRCQRSWVLWAPDRTDEGRRHGSVYICVGTLADGTLQVMLTEGPPNTEWSPKADSLRRALADTLGRFGIVAVAPFSVLGTNR